MDVRVCLLVIIGVTEHGRKELVAVEDGYRESLADWQMLLTGLRERGLPVAPKLAVADGALGFWAALNKVFPQTAQQRCWVHKTANVLNKLPKRMQPRVKESLQDIWMAESRAEAHKAFDLTLKRYQAKFPKAMECLAKDREEMLAFYDFPAEHWAHLRTTNPIESTFASVRLRTKKSRNCGSRNTTLAMVVKLRENAQKRWRRIRGFRKRELVINNVRVQEGQQVTDHSNMSAACAPYTRFDNNSAEAESASNGAGGPLCALVVICTETLARNVKWLSSAHSFGKNNKKIIILIITKQE